MVCTSHIDTPVERIGAYIFEAIGDEVDRLATGDDDILDDGRRLAMPNGPVADDAEGGAGYDAALTPSPFSLVWPSVPRTVIVPSAGAVQRRIAACRGCSPG